MKHTHHHHFPSLSIRTYHLDWCWKLELILLVATIVMQWKIRLNILLLENWFFGFSLPAKIKQKSSTCLKFLIAMVTMCCTYYPLWKQKNSIFFYFWDFVISIFPISITLIGFYCWKYQADPQYIYVPVYLYKLLKIAQF